MADTAVAIKDASGNIVPVDGYTPTGGTDVRQAVVVGDAATLNTLAVAADGSLAVREVVPSTATRTTWTTSGTAATILASSPTRTGFSIFNGSNATVYLGLGTVNPGASNFSVKLDAGSYYEAPFRYRGEVRAWATGSLGGLLQVTELS